VNDHSGSGFNYAKAARKCALGPFGPVLLLLEKPPIAMGFKDSSGKIAGKAAVNFHPIENVAEVEVVKNNTPRIPP